MLRFNLTRLALVALTAVALSPVASQAAENRCGWIENDMPSELALKDRDGRWEIASMVYEAAGFENMPSTSKGDSCGCLSVEVNPQTKQVTKLFGGKLKPTKACAQDKSLK